MLGIKASCETVIITSEIVSVLNFALNLVAIGIYTIHLSQPTEIWAI